MRRRGWESVDQHQHRLLECAPLVPLIFQLGDDFHRLLLRFGQSLISSLKVVLEHLLLAPEEFLSPSLFVFTFGFSLGSVDPHFLEHRVDLPEQTVQLFVPLRRIGLSGFPPGGRRLLARSRFLGLCYCCLSASSGGLRDGSGSRRLRGRCGNDFRQFLPTHQRDCARP